MHFKQKVLKFILTHTFLVLVTVGPGHGVYRIFYTLVGGQRAEKFENHRSTTIKPFVVFEIFWERASRKLKVSLRNNRCSHLGVALAQYRFYNKNTFCLSRVFFLLFWAWEACCANVVSCYLSFFLRRNLFIDVKSMCRQFSRSSNRCTTDFHAVSLHQFFHGREFPWWAALPRRCCLATTRASTTATAPEWTFSTSSKTSSNSVLLLPRVALSPQTCREEKFRVFLFSSVFA